MFLTVAAVPLISNTVRFTPLLCALPSDMKTSVKASAMSTPSCNRGSVVLPQVTSTLLGFPTLFYNRSDCIDTYAVFGISNNLVLPLEIQRNQNMFHCALL